MKGACVCISQLVLNVSSEWQKFTIYTKLRVEILHPADCLTQLS